ncbi:MAG: Ribulose-phosphate 3-epimerase [candidate division TM6 bacterium GW2011_GWF2_43_17]|nr:MAG: Ribulose-phosphate 3-epimerase [candidate division TM6 bacterium GW2011_GWF2_43_17]HAU30173.1 hypothetical protein [Candidatus Dependentiae bacterium]
MRIFPSLMAANQLYLGDIVVQLEPLCDGFHLDIMDLEFVDNLIGGISLANQLGHAVKKPLWVDLFLSNPRTVLSRLELDPNDIVTIHAESTFDPVVFDLIREKKCLASLAINPETPLEKILPFIHNKQIDHLVLMSVIPGASGRPFVEATLKKAAQAYQITQQYGITIAMDGGISRKNIESILALGVGDIVIGSALFSTENPVEELLHYQEWRKINTLEQ